MRHEEESLQINCVKWFSLQYPAYSTLLHHSPNGGRRNIREATRFKAMGTRAGFPDLALLIPKGGYHGLFIEMKAAKGRQSPEQKVFEKALTAEGYKYIVVRSFAEFMAIINSYLNEI